VQALIYLLDLNTVELVLPHIPVHIMSASNNGSLNGRIVSDITTRYPDNTRISVTEFRVIPSDAPEGSSAIPVTCYNGYGENLAQWRNQGDLVSLRYHVVYKTWQTEEGEYRSKYELVVDECYCLALGKISAEKRASEQEVKSTTKVKKSVAA